MASKQNTVDFLCEQMAEAGMISARKMFGDYALYCNGKVVGLICDDQLFVKPTEKGKEYIGDPEMKLPYTGARPYFWIDGERWDDREWMSELIRITEEVLPLPKRR